MWHVNRNRAAAPRSDLEQPANDDEAVQIWIQVSNAAEARAGRQEDEGPCCCRRCLDFLNFRALEPDGEDDGVSMCLPSPCCETMAATREGPKIQWLDALETMIATCKSPRAAESHEEWTDKGPAATAACLHRHVGVETGSLVNYG